MAGLKFIALMGLAVLLVACSKTVQWEEEVPLNTGEVIWVKRTDTYERAFANNPFKPTWALDRRSYTFTLNGQSFVFEDIKESIGAFLLFVHPNDNTVTIVAGAASCSKPGYGEYQWRNGTWLLQKSVNPALIGRPRNLMDYYSGLEGDIPSKVTQEYIASQHFEDPRRGGSLTHLLESKIAINCSGGK